MTTLIENYLREVEASLRVDAARKRQIVDELRTHLTEKVADLRASHPERSAFELEQEVLHEFGNPRDLALAYQPDGSAVLTSAAGDIVLRVGHAVGRGARAVGRGTGAVLKWTAVALGILLAISLGVGAWAYYEVKPYIPSIIESSDPVYTYYESCVGTPCQGALPADTFYVRPEAQTVRFDLDVRPVRLSEEQAAAVPANGSVRVVVADPSGEVRFDRTYELSPMVEGSAAGGRARQLLSWSAVEGNWTVAYTFTDFVGTVQAQTYAIRLPFTADR
ncbi:MAG TPA: hypothetical protein VFH78_08515 [Candidatus Thermoplasmatota archaeon]|nr:hypothetical protein [Candidatus Thermoplasmatota archaeon]